MSSYKTTSETKSSSASCAAVPMEPAGLDDPEVDFKTESITLRTSTGRSVSIRKNYLKLAKKLWAAIESDVDATELDVAYPDLLEHPDRERLLPVFDYAFDKVVEYLNHHEGVQPDPVPCPVNARIMIRNCKDPWDAVFIDTLTLEPPNLRLDQFQYGEYYVTSEDREDKQGYTLRNNLEKHYLYGLYPKRTEDELKAYNAERLLQRREGRDRLYCLMLLGNMLGMYWTTPVPSELKEPETKELKTTVPETKSSEEKSDEKSGPSAKDKENVIRHGLVTLCCAKTGCLMKGHEIPTIEWILDLNKPDHDELVDINIKLDKEDVERQEKDALEKIKAGLRPEDKLPGEDEFDLELDEPESKTE